VHRSVHTIHYGTFQLTKEYFHESVDELNMILKDRPSENEFLTLKQGETLVLDKPSDRPCTTPIANCNAG